MKSPEQAVPAQEPEPKRSGGFSRYVAPIVVAFGALTSGKSPDMSPPPERTVETPVVVAPTKEKEKQKPFRFEIGPLAGKFTPKVQLAGDLTILHVGQIHSVGELALDEDVGTAPYIVRAQQDIRDFIAYVFETYGIDTIFLEGFDEQSIGIHSLYDGFNKWDGVFQGAIKNQDAVRAHLLVDSLVKDYEANLPTFATGENESLQGGFEYFILHRLQKYESLLAALDRSPEAAAHKEKINGLIETFSQKKLIQGDAKFVTVGGALISCIEGEGKIKLEAADDNAARQEIVNLHKRAPTKDAPAEIWAAHDKKIRAFAQIRENVAIRRMRAWMKEHGKQVALLDYGTKHIVVGNALEDNKKHPGEPTLGVTKCLSEAAREARSLSHPFLREDPINTPEDGPEDW